MVMKTWRAETRREWEDYLSDKLDLSDKIITIIIMFETYSSRIQPAQHRNHKRTRSCLTRQCNAGWAAVDQPVAVVEDVTVGMPEVPLHCAR